MYTLDINFALRRPRVSGLGGALLLLGVSAGCVVAWNYAEAHTQLEQAQARLARLQRSASSTPRPAVQTSGPREDDKAHLKVSSQLRRPWSGLLSEIDLVSSPAIALLSVESQGQSRTLRITGDAKSMGDAVAYVNRLRQSSLIEAVYLSQHEDRLAGPVHVVRFSLDATWKAQP
jgi:hypothetical protein